MRFFLATILLFLSTFASNANAGLGSVRFTVLTTQPSHTYPGQISANGHVLTTIRHSDGRVKPSGEAVPGPWIPLTLNHLGTTSNSTPLTISYSWSNTDDCDFWFMVEYLPEGKTAAVPLGLFRAPVDRSIGLIPLGRKCDQGLPVCSSDPVVQTTYVWEFVSAFLNFLFKFNTSIDQSLQNRVQIATAKADSTAKALSQAPLPSFDANQEALARQIESWNQEFEDMKSRATQRTDQANGEDVHDPTPVNADEMADKADSEADNQIAAQTPQQDPSPWSVGGFDRGIVEREEEYRAVLDEDVKNGTALPEDVRGQEDEKRAVEMFRRDILRGHAICNGAVTIGKYASSVYAPSVGTAIKLIEIARGQDVCPYSQKYTPEEEAEKTCELVVKLPVKWIRTGQQLQNLLFGAADPGTAGKLLISEIQKKTIAGGCGALVK